MVKVPVPIDRQSPAPPLAPAIPPPPAAARSVAALAQPLLPIQLKSRPAKPKSPPIKSSRQPLRAAALMAPKLEEGQIGIDENSTLDSSQVSETLLPAGADGSGVAPPQLAVGDEIPETSDSILAALDVGESAPASVAESLISVGFRNSRLTTLALIRPGGLPSHDAVRVVIDQMQSHPDWETLRAGARMPDFVPPDFVPPVVSTASASDGGDELRLGVEGLSSTSAGIQHSFVLSRVRVATVACRNRSGQYQLEAASHTARPPSGFHPRSSTLELAFTRRRF